MRAALLLLGIVLALSGPRAPRSAAPRRGWALAAALFVMIAASAGCVANMADLKEKVQPAATVPDPTPTETPLAQTNATNLTPPVARIQVFGASNALLYKAGFQAENLTTPLLVPANVELTFLSGDSEAVAQGARIAKATWTLNGKVIDGAKATATLPGPGLYPLVLTVTDTQGATDEQAIPLGVMPDPFDVYLNLTAPQMAGANGQGQGARLAFSLTAADAGKPATIQGVKVVAAAPLTCDVTLALLDGEGKEVANANAADASTGDQTETLDAGALPEAGYAVSLTPNACLAPDGFPVSVIVTYLPIVPGVTDAGGDGHHHAH